MSRLNASIVKQFFDREQEDARRVLRTGMDTCVDTVFGQMKQKFVKLLDNEEKATTVPSNHQQADRDHHEEQQQLYPSSNQIPPTSTNQFSPNISIKEEFTDDESNGQHLLTNVGAKTTETLNLNEVVVKNELDEINVNVIVPNESITAPSSAQSQLSNYKLKSSNHTDDEDEDCDCKECVEDFCVKKEVMNDDQREIEKNVQLIEQKSDDSNPKPNKPARLENDQSRDRAEPNNQITNRYITISLKCSQCSEMYQDRNGLNAHLESVHSIKKYKCLYKDCKQSFDKRNDFGHHLRTGHTTQPNTNWPCGYCPRSFKQNDYLLRHYTMLHEEGTFRCSFPACQFTGELKQTVHNHFMMRHKGLACPFAGCAYRCQQAYELRQHQRTHRSAKPYRCKLAECTYDSAYKATALHHIDMHLKQVWRENKQLRNIMSDDVNDYLEVVHELL